MSRVAGPWMNVATVSCSASTCAASRSRSSRRASSAACTSAGTGHPRARAPCRAGAGPPAPPAPPRPPPPRPAGPLPPFHLAPPPPPPPQGVERPVARDRQYPWHERAAARVVLINPPPHLHEHVPHHLLGLV